MTMPDTPARADLAAAQGRHKEAEQLLSERRATLQKANDLLCAKHATLQERFFDLSTRISEARANNIRIALERGETPLLDEAPEGFAAELVARDRLQTEIAALEEAIEQLEADASEAEEIVDLAWRHVELAAESVFGREFAALAEEFLEKLERMRKIQYLLHAASMRQMRRGPHEPRAGLPQIGYVPAAISTSIEYRRLNFEKVVHDALRDSVIGDYERRCGFTLQRRMGAISQHFWTELLKNPEAQLDIDDDAPVAGPIEVPRPNIAAYGR